MIIVGKTNAIETAKWLYIAEVLFPIAGPLARISALLLYRAIFGKGNRKFNIGLNIVGSQWIVLAVAGFFCTLLQCVPIKRSWTQIHDAQHCLDLEKMVLSLTIYSVFVNFATLALPIPLIWRLKLTLRRKLAIGALFVLAGG